MYFSLTKFNLFTVKRKRFWCIKINFKLNVDQIRKGKCAKEKRSCHVAYKSRIWLVRAAAVKHTRHWQVNFLCSSYPLFPPDWADTKRHKVDNLSVVSVGLRKCIWMRAAVLRDELIIMLLWFSLKFNGIPWKLYLHKK